MIRSKTGQRLGGLVMAAAAGGFTAYTWYLALTEGYYYRRAVAFFPAFLVIGIGLMAFPLDVDRFREQHGVDRPQSFAQLPTSWKILVFAAIGAGLVNWYAISQL